MMKRFAIQGLAVMLLCAVFMGGCYYDNEEYLYPEQGGPGGCDTTNVTYSGTIAQILSTNCIGCHSATNPNAGVILTNYSDLKVQVDNGRFWGAVNHESGFANMPPSGSKLSNCNLARIRKWIDDGAQNN